MGKTLAFQLLATHLVEGTLEKGAEIGIRIDQTLTQDSTGTMAYLQLEAMGIDQVKTDQSVAYVDHNMLQEGFENADDHRYLQTVASKHGIWFSRPGNGICHQVHLERFGVPGGTLLGSDSHTPTCGGLGMLAIGAGGLDVAMAMGGFPYRITVPEVVGVRLVGKLSPFVSAKDVILEVLRTLTVKGGVGRIIEYFGPGVKSLTVPERATITNMGAELGATTSIFESDEVTRLFLEAQNRGGSWQALAPEPGCVYDLELEIDLSTLVPMTAAPHSPDNVFPVTEFLGKPVDQVAIGSCTNSSYRDLMIVAAILKGKTIAPQTSLVISPGSRQVLGMLAQNGALHDILASGARVLECGCGPCIGMGQAPSTDAISLRTFNRNFKGRSGTASAGVFLVSPETAAASALTGVFTDPRTLGAPLNIATPAHFVVNDNMILPPADHPEQITVVRGPNIKPFPLGHPLEDEITGKILLIAEDNITTDHIMPSSAKLLPFRSNIPHLAGFCLVPCDPDFPARAKENGGGFIVAGENYGQGSSREHAALVPLYLGVRGVIAKSFARIHKANLINSGILPLTFLHPEDYHRIGLMDSLCLPKITASILDGSPILAQVDGLKDLIPLVLDVTENEGKMLIAGGKINLLKEKLTANQ